METPEEFAARYFELNESPDGPSALPEMVRARDAALVEEHSKSATDVCRAMEQWKSAIHEAHDGDPDWTYKIEALETVFLMIHKSDLLYRLIYNKEPLRTEKCPEHHGVWHGIESDHRCPHGCGLTGWLRAQPEAAPGPDKSTAR